MLSQTVNMKGMKRTKDMKYPDAALGRASTETPRLALTAERR